MNFADVIALYGGGLATLLAVIQYRQWRSADQPLVVTLSKECDPPPALTEAVITNTQQMDVYVDFVGIGYEYRPWRSPWKRAHDDIFSMKACEGGCLSGKGAGGLLKAGAFMEVYFEEADYRALTRPPARSGFFRRLMLWVEHSRSDVPYRKLLRLST
jgi:hypothetical protein